MVYQYDRTKNGRMKHNDGFTCKIPAFSGECLIEILVEGMGRVNYGPHLADRKGIARVRHGMQDVFGWEIYTLPWIICIKSFLSIRRSAAHPDFAWRIRCTPGCRLLCGYEGIPEGVCLCQWRSYRPLLEPWPPAHTLPARAVPQGTK